jgi:hypothetical protein
MTRRAKWLVTLALTLSLLTNLLFASINKSQIIANPTAVVIVCPVVCCLFDWGCFLNPFTDNGQCSCCQPGCVGCIEIDGWPCCNNVNQCP